MESKIMIIGTDDENIDKDTIISAIEEVLEKMKKEFGGQSSIFKKTKEPSWQWLIKRKGETEYTLTDSFYTESEFKEDFLGEDSDIETYEKFDASKRMN